MISKDDREQIKAFVDNPAMFAAVTRVLNPVEEIASGLPIQDDAEYGRAVRAWVGARELVKAFDTSEERRAEFALLARRTFL